MGCPPSNLQATETSLTLQDEPLRQLLRCLDQALLHGLRHLANGYWLFVREFSHNQSVEFIQKKKHLNTHLGKGRAWLYLALNDASLESYIRLFSSERQVVNKYYIGTAFIRDDQRMEMLTTMVSGLEYISFQLDLDASYLNHSILPLSAEELVIWQNEEIPFHAPNWSKNLISQTSVPSLDSPSQPQDSGFVTMENSQIQLTEHNANGTNRDGSLAVLGEELFHAVNKKCLEEVDADITDDDVTVVRVRNKVKRRKKPPEKSLNRITSNGSISEQKHLVDEDQNSASQQIHAELNQNETSDPHSSMRHSPTELTKQNASETSDETVGLPGEQIEVGSGVNDVDDPAVRLQAPNEPSSPTLSNGSVDELQQTPAQNNRSDNSGDKIQSEVDGTTNANVKSTEELIVQISNEQTLVNSCSLEQTRTDGDVIVVESANSTKASLFDTSSVSENHSDVAAMHSVTDENRTEFQSSQAEKICGAEASIVSKVVSEIKPAIKLRTASGGSEARNSTKRVSFEVGLIDDDFSINPEMRGSPEGEEAPSVFASTPNLKEPTLYVAGAAKPASSPKLSPFQALPKLEPSEASMQAQQFTKEMNTEIRNALTDSAIKDDIKVDNNTLLRLMLDVFADEEELYKMYHASVGHTENEHMFLFPVLTNKHLYLLTHQNGSSEFHLAMRISYTEVDYLLLGLSYQTILVVCKRRRKRFAICTGDENLTRSIVASLEIAIRRWCPSTVLPCVFTDGMMQMIGLQKFIAAQTNVERHDVVVTHYALVHWEDPQVPSTPHCPAGPSRQGYLMYRHCVQSSSEADLEDVWHPGYFMLRAGVLYRFRDNESTDLEWYVQLHGNEILGCRRSATQRRPHVFEMQTNNGSRWELAAPNEYDASDWLQAFLQTVSNEMQCDDDQDGNIHSCCLVMASQKLFICNEDLEMFMFTPLGSANVTDLITVCVDKAQPTYCVMEFESVEAGICAGDWIIYFASEAELRKFLHSLENIWRELFQVALPVHEMEDETVRSKCGDHARILQTSWRLSFNVLQEPATIVRTCPSPQ